MTDGRPYHVAAQSFEALAVSAVDRRPDVYVDAAEISERLVGRVELAHRMDELARLLARRCSEELPITNRRAVAGRQRGLLVGELVDDIVKTVERATMSREHPSDGLVSPASDFGDLLGRRSGQRVKVKLTLAVTDVDAVEDAVMAVYVEAKRGVGALDERHGAGLRVLDRIEAARLLRPASK